MRNLKIISLFLLPLFGCFAQLENPDIALTHDLCNGTGNCMPSNMPLGLIQVSGQNTFTVDFGDQPLLQPSTSIGPATVSTSLILNGAAIQLKNPGPGDNFSQVSAISLLAARTSSTDCSATPINCTLLADYNQTRDGAANQSITLRGYAVDLITLMASTHALDLQLQASGTGPAGNWNADVSMDMGLKARANFP